MWFPHAQGCSLQVVKSWCFASAAWIVRVGDETQQSTIFLQQVTCYRFNNLYLWLKWRYSENIELWCMETGIFIHLNSEVKMSKEDNSCKNVHVLSQTSTVETFVSEILQQYLNAILNLITWLFKQLNNGVEHLTTCQSNEGKLPLRVGFKY